MRDKLTMMLRVRVTPALDSALRREAARLRLRPADLVRYTLARAVAEGIGGESVKVEEVEHAPA